MALKMDYVGDKGQIAAYHRIQVVAQVYVAGNEHIEINLAGYTSEDYRNAEKNGGGDKVLMTTPIAMVLQKDADGNFIEDFSRKTLYSRIKAEVPEFNDAEDC